MKVLEDKIMRASESTNARFKRKKIRSMKCEVNKIAEKLAESETKLSKVPITHKCPPDRNKCIESKIAVLNKKIRRAKNNKNKKFLIAKRESLKAELNSKPEPRLLEGAFGGVYRRYRIDGNRTDPDTFFRIIRNLLIDMLRKESRTGAVRSQTTTWLRFRKDDELIELAFNSRTMNVYNLSDIGEIVDEMIANMHEQIKNSALANSRFVFDEVLHIDTDFHQLNLTRGSSYIPLPDWFAHKKAIINPKNEDQDALNGQ